MSGVGQLLSRRRVAAVRVLAGRDATAYLAYEWPLLYGRDPQATVYQEPAWVRGWAAQRPAGAEPLVLVAESAYGPAALALLAETVGGETQIRPLGAPLAEYIRPVGPAADHPAATAALARQLVQWGTQGARVTLSDVPASSGLAQQISGAGWEHTTVPCAHIQLPVPYEAMSRSTRRDHIRRERTWTALETAGRATYTHTTTVNELATGITDALHLHRRQWASNPVHDSPSDGLAEVLIRCGPRTAAVAQLRLDGSLVAAAVVLYQGTRCYSLLPAMDTAVSDLAPGHALIRRMASRLTQRGMDVLDLGRTRLDRPGTASYKAQYLPDWTYSLTASPAPADRGSGR
ncbi:GNAT family N-acetyltransferase [Streptomyces sp. NPDC004296]|uniref:GNAT family N-acetyltransferase n=1 Tax=Streptomyces sp. NPDC004296 TaxID=3364697 RepID=UPI00369472A0